MKKETLIGAIVFDENGNVNTYERESTFNGWCFKDEDAWKSRKGICYISEYGSQSIEDELASLSAEYDNSNMSEEEYLKRKEEIFHNNGYTRKDIVDMCGGKGFEKLAESIFYEIDWQSPQTPFYEFDSIDFEYYGITREMLKNNPVYEGWEIVDD